MAVKIRLARRGRTHTPFFSIVVADARAPRDGKYLAKVGTYNPNRKPAELKLDIEQALAWLQKGAQPTPTVRHILSSQGVLLQKHLQAGIQKGVITQEIADQRFAVWKQTEEKKKKKSFQPIVAPSQASPA